MPGSNGGAELDAIVNQVVAEAHLNRSLILPEEIDYIREHLLKKPLRMIHIWALGVGVVITGEYFGWNFGLPVGGPVGVLIASLIVCVLYLAWVLTLSELSVAMPFAGGPMAYGRRASGKLLGLMMGWSMFLQPPHTRYLRDGVLSWRSPLGPAELFHRQAGMPYLGHVDDLVALELHDIDVVGAGPTSGRRNGTAGAGMGAMKHAVGRDVVSRCVGSERLYLVVAVWQNRHNTLHPVRVLRERLYFEQRLGLSTKSGVGRAVTAACLPSLTRLAGGEEGFGDTCDRCHVDLSCSM